MTTALHPGSKFDRVMRILAEGPATTGEVSAELDIPSNQASALLRDLEMRGYAHAKPYGERSRLKLWHAGRSTVPAEKSA